MLPFFNIFKTACFNIATYTWDLNYLKINSVNFFNFKIINAFNAFPFLS